MKVKGYTVSLLLLFLTSLLLSEQRIKEKDLPQKYQDWLKQTSYIILPREKEVFMKLTTDRDRDIFIEIFWKQRDPTPGTPQNEYKDELTKRFLYANKRFKRSSAREGWMTDMGRFYIILGPPVSIERFEGVKSIYPAQVWYYYGDKKKGLPPHFALVFYKRGGAGEYKLYDPATDGPANLMIRSQLLDPMDYEQLYEKIRELAPTLALVSLSMIPGEIPYNYQPSTRNAMIVADILESPKNDVSPSYASHFLNYKGIVSTEYLSNYVENECHFVLFRDPILNLNFVHFSIVPQKVSIDYYEPKDQYYCNFQLNVSLRLEDNIIFQYSKDFPFYFPSDDIERIRANGISIEDSFPIIEGKYRLIILLQNSVGKEFSVFESDIFMPEESGIPKIGGFILGYRFQNYDISQHIPFKIADKKLLVDPKNTFSSADHIALLFSLTNVTEDLWEGGEIRILIKGLKEKNPSNKYLTLKLKDFPFNRILTINHSIPAIDLVPDYYEMRLSFMDEKGITIDEKNANFIVSPLENISHPIARMKGFLLSNNFLYLYLLADQYEKLNDYEKAEANFKRAYELKPDYKKGLVRYSNFLLKIQKFKRASELIESLKEDERLRFEYYLIKGIALTGEGQYSEAINNLLEGNKIYNSDTKLLNSLGFCYYKIGKKKEALEVLKASLRLNPEQKKIKILIEEIGK